MGSFSSPAFWSALLFGIHGAFFLPLAWASGAQELLALLFSALALVGWLACLKPEPRASDHTLMILCPVLFLLALLCKEGVVVLPVLAVILAFLLKARPGRRAWFAAGACLLILLAWMTARLHMANPIDPDSPYAPRLGFNVLRNGLALVFFYFNTPREAMRLMLRGQIFQGALWGGGVLLIHALVVILVARRVLAANGRRVLLYLAGFTLAAAFPYLFPGWNCYPYYLLLGLFSWGILVAMWAKSGGKHRGKTMEHSYSKPSRAPVILAIGAFLLSVGGQYFLGYPAIMARAMWAEKTLNAVEKKLEQTGIPEQGPIILHTPDESRLAALGWQKGIAWRMGISADRVVIPEEPDIKGKRWDSLYPENAVHVRISPDGLIIDIGDERYSLPSRKRASGVRRPS